MINRELLEQAIAEAYALANAENKRQNDEEPEQSADKVPE